MEQERGGCCKPRSRILDNKTGSDVKIGRRKRRKRPRSTMLLLRRKERKEKKERKREKTMVSPSPNVILATFVEGSMIIPRTAQIGSFMSWHCLRTR